METARLQQQREEEAEARRQARAAEKAAEKAGLLRKPLVAPAATVAAKEESTWRRTPRTDGQQPTVPARSESPAPAVAKYKPPAGGGWRAKMEAKQAAAAAGGGSGREAAAAAAAPAVLAPTAAQASSVPLKELKKDEDGFQTVPTRSTKEPWRARRGRA